jgi:1,4-alpha-glucan branching enzyme
VSFFTPEVIELDRVAEGRAFAPSSVLGRRDDAGRSLWRVWLPRATAVRVESGAPFEIAGRRGFFEWRGAAGALPRHVRLVWTDERGGQHAVFDPYTFECALGEQDLHYFNEGTHRRLYDVMGVRWAVVGGVAGVRFAVWAPNAESVAVVGDFNGWDDRVWPLQSQGTSGVWCLFVPELVAGARYKYAIRTRSGETLLKADPFARACERPPATASVLTPPSTHVWQDAAWLATRSTTDVARAPMSIYEVHLGSWQRGEHGEWLDYGTLADRLAERALELGFSHVELLPVTEHPFDGSWGYQSLGYFAPTSRFGTPDDFRAFVDRLHGHGLGVLLDWVPAHFPRDSWGLARFDGTALFEHEDPRLAEHRDWATLIFNYGRNEVRAFLIASALYWLDEFHVDGLRVDAVASMLYLDYSRAPGEWVPNRYGGRENLEAIEFLRTLNEEVRHRFQGAVTIAEESTAWPGVTAPVVHGGLGFTFKWNMGWMNDTLDYMGRDPIHRRYHHDRLTFGMLYAFSERFVLPLSHDEVVHGKGSLVGRMPGDDWRKFANLRLLFVYQWTLPGKKLLFMGGEIGQWQEWDHDGAVDWRLLQHAPHERLERLVSDLNGLYRTEPALGNDLDWHGFEWLDCEDRLHSLLAFVRRDAGAEVIVALNFTPVPRAGYRLGVPAPGHYEEILNSDSFHYGGTNLGNHGGLATEPVPAMGRPHSLTVTLPPLAGVVFRRHRDG